MNKIMAACLLGLTLVLLPTLSEAGGWRNAKPEDHPEQLNAKRYAKEDAIYKAYLAQVAKALDKSDTATLEKMASSAWKSKASWGSGYPKLAGFYSGIEEYCGDFKASDQERWDRLFLTIGRWEKADPQSPFAKLAWVRVLIDRAWSVRGSKFSGETPDAAMASFQSKMEEAGQLLQSSRPLTSTVPEWYEQMVDVDTALSVPLDQITSLADEGIEKFPSYYPIAVAASTAFLTKWGGSDAQFAQFAHHVAAVNPDNQGPALYMRIYYNASCCDYYDGAVFTKGAADWPMLKQGLKANLRQYPDPVNEDIAAYFSCSAMDVELLPKLMDKIGSSPHPAIWKDLGFFRDCQEMTRLMKLRPEGSKSDWYPHH